LNLIPFSALINEHDRYLVETYRITYLTGGRDLLRLQSQKAGNNTSVVIANPAFDGRLQRGNPQANDNGKAGPMRRTADLTKARFDLLPGTASEGAALKRILPNVVL